MIILGIDPGLVKTGWGVVGYDSGRLRFVACGLIRTDRALPLPDRLAQIDKGLCDVVESFKPGMAAVEETFVNKNPASALKLGFARGVALAAPARLGLEVGEYSANHVKKAVVGSGHADKRQIRLMVGTLLPLAEISYEDEADALAVAICHAHHIF